MEVRPGYKQTEVGAIPADWEVQPVRNIVERLDAGVSVNSVDEDLKKYAHSQCILKTSAVFEGRFLPHECKKIAPRDLWRVSLRPRADTILISRMNTPDLVGECGYVAADQEDLFLPDRLWMTKKRPESDASIHWLSYLLCSKPQKSRIKALATGTSGSMKNIAKDSLLDLPIAVPTAPEQRAIATALSDVDALLGGLDRLIAKKIDLKQAAMQQLLTGQTRLPGFHGEWEVKLLPEVSRFRGGKAHEQYIAEHGRFVCVNSKFISSEGKIRKYATANFCCAKAKDILMVMSDLPNGKALAKTFLADSDNLYAVNQRVCALTVNDDYCAEFLSHILNRNPYFLKFDDGVSQTHLLNPVFQKCPLFLPSTKDEQTAIAAVLSDMDAELAALEARRDKTRDLKQAMMQELLTGRVRLVN